MLKKIFINLTSWQFVTIKDDYKIIIFGPEAKSQLNYFKKNFFYFNLNKNNIFNFKLIFPGIIYFLSLLATRPFILLKYTKLWPKLFFLIAIIKLKKIKKLICLVDYNQWPKIIKMLLGNEVKTIAIQNSFRGYPLYRPTLTKNFDEYFMWSDFNDEEKKIIKSKLLDFGALKSYLVVNKNNLWNLIKEIPNNTDLSRPKELVLISSFSFAHVKFYNKYLRDIPLTKFSATLENLEKKCLEHRFFGKLYSPEKNMLFRKRNILFQCIEFFKMCLFIKDYVKSNKIKLSIFERNAPNNEYYISEKISFKRIFNQDLFLNLNAYEKIEYIVKNINAVFITNISNLGKECLALNRKSFFFSTLLHYYNKDSFDYSSKIFCIEKSSKNFQESLNYLFNMKSDEFTKAKSELKKTVNSCNITQEKFKNFLKITGLEIN